MEMSCGVICALLMSAMPTKESAHTQTRIANTNTSTHTHANILSHTHTHAGIVWRLATAYFALIGVSNAN